MRPFKVVSPHAFRIQKWAVASTAGGEVEEVFSDARLVVILKCEEYTPLNSHIFFNIFCSNIFLYTYTHT